MIPSLVVSEIRRALVEYLATTFALSDDDVREALTRFLTDRADGIFRGPYLRVRTPFVSVDDGWESPLDWLPEGFQPWIHQATAFERLSSVDGSSPQPTIVSTGTGSGKTECFLYPILDHCARAGVRGETGIKALILYPMNALASDQAGRLARLIHGDPRLAGITAGLYIGEDGRHATMTPDRVIDQRDALRADPPDILLTNYKMLDFLLLRREDRDLWAANTPVTLAYVVLDEFHTYDGAQGTDVAMLLRRLGRTLGMAAGDRPLGATTPIATSATLGEGPAVTTELRDFAGKVFGVPFDVDSVIGETRQTVEEACGPVNYLLPIPSPAEVVEIPADDPDAVAAAFCDPIDDADGELAPLVPGDVVGLGDRLLAHPLTRAVLAAVGSRARSWSETVAEVITRAPDWGRTHMRDPAQVEEALGRLLWLLSIARRRHGDGVAPLFSVEAQLWVREVSRVLRTVHPEPAFRWRDSGATEPAADDEPKAVSHELPAIYCRRCGSSGWMAVASELGSVLLTNPAAIYQASVKRSPTVRALLRAHPDDPAARHYDPAARQLRDEPTDDSVPVLITRDEDAARRSRCPACDEPDTIRFLGLQVASLASVSINTLFGSPHVNHEERKLLTFTDSVQDASHRAAFFAGRTYRINLRSLMARIIAEHGSLTLADLGDSLVGAATSGHDRYRLVPPDLLRHRKVRTTWTDDPDPEGIDILQRRIAFEVDLEFGLRSRVGRTLELAGAAAASVHVRDLDALADLIIEDVQTRLGEVPEAALRNAGVYLRGLLERLRLRGGITNPLLEPYVADNGRMWHVWGGRPDGLPPFTPGQVRPLFATTAPKGDFDSVTALAATPTWAVDWGVRVLGVDAAAARDTNRRAFALLAAETDTVTSVVATKDVQVYGLDRNSVWVSDAADNDDGEPEPSLLCCQLCGHRHSAPPEDLEQWHGTPCLRYRCPGRFEIAEPDGSNYYRRLYREGIARRVVTGEHTGLLSRRAREDLEAAFKDGTSPEDPNVIAATPTLEMGIDIGDLSAVMLTSVPPTPANYIQRVGRAGRRSGNALVTAFARGDTHDLYYLADPEAMIVGDVRPPNCYLDARETLQRQFVAYLIDRVADLSLDAPPLPNHIIEVMTHGLDEGGLLRRLVDAATLDPEHIEEFLALFGDHLLTETVESLRDFASHGIESFLKTAVETWQAAYRELGLRRDRLNTAIKKIEQSASPSADDEDTLASLRGQRAAIVRLLGASRHEYTLSALERLGVLPNYTLVDDAIVLEATMWSRREDGEYEVETYEYPRSGSFAVQEFAPANSFYAGGHRHVIDALEIGSADRPLYEPWRLCPACGYGTPQPDQQAPATCPRCGDPGIGDADSRHTMLRLRTARAAASEESARVYDETDDRRREHYEVITTVDADPVSIGGAWKLADRAFGAELARRTHLRTINLGLADRSGEKVPIAGADRHVTGFEVCRHCGAARDARDDRNGTRTDRLHHGWCKVRSGAVAAAWDRIVLYHELTTEAVRLLLPVSLFEVEERLASFKGALLLGLRQDFGGDPDHLEVVRSELPNRSGLGRYHFLVLYDRVPGGTGYLGRLADPDRVRTILQAARHMITRCPCRAEGLVACHRCLLGVIDRNEYELVSRDLALSLLDDLLDHWQPDDSIVSVAHVDIAQVEQSELERRFKVALQDWAARTDGTTILPLPAQSGRTALELRIAQGDRYLRYRIDEQEHLPTTPSTIPDYVIKRVDAPGRDIAVYLDGFQFHASPESNNIAADAAKRAGVRASGRLVWNFIWEGVTSFHEAILSEPPRTPPQRPLLNGKARGAARRIHHDRSGAIDFDAVDRNGVSLLLSYLQDPSDGDWERLALSAVGGAVAGGGLSSAGSETLSRVVDQLAAGETPTGSSESATPVAHVGCWTTPRGLPMSAALDASDPDQERWTVFAVLPDSEEDVARDGHLERWRDWLQWANLLQFLGPIDAERSAWIAASSQSSSAALEDLWIRTLSTEGEPPPIRPERYELTEDQLAELDLITDSNVCDLVDTVLRAGAPDFEAGAEREGVPIEAAWVNQRVGIMPEGDERTVTGWDLRPYDRWTADELIDRLQE